ncbi:MAG TPA: hypothetical protein VFP09_05400, partial [Desertimonas sp.]|nr:hypothetical protein [Desertimonas sp.]
MSPETDQRDKDAGRAEPDAEQEVDLGRYWWRIVGHWWVVVGAVVLGAVIGYLVSLGGGTVYQARATVYLGQPLGVVAASRGTIGIRVQIGVQTSRPEPGGHLRWHMTT